jgi:hypothetical protein
VDVVYIHGHQGPFSGHFQDRKDLGHQQLKESIVIGINVTICLIEDVIELSAGLLWLDCEGN